MEEKYSPFHREPIKKGEYGDLSKISEELQEAYDAEAQGIDLMLLIELSDIIGAVEGVAKNYGFTLEQLIAYSNKRSEVAEYELQNKQPRPSHPEF